MVNHSSAVSQGNLAGISQQLRAADPASENCGLGDSGLAAEGVSRLADPGGPPVEEMTPVGPFSDLALRLPVGRSCTVTHDGIPRAAYRYFSFVSAEGIP